MGKIHVVTRKEEIDGAKMKDKIAVVFDVLLATSTIATVLEHGARSVIPVLDGEQARSLAAEMNKDDCMLVGEYEGRTIDGFLDPNPSALKAFAKGKKIILSTTNGTVAVHKSSPARRIFACSLLNAKAVADALAQDHREDTIILVCSGSSGHFSLEDFYGAGCLIQHLDEAGCYELSDAAQTAKLFYEGCKEEPAVVLAKSKVGKMLKKYGFQEEITFISTRDCFSCVPVLYGDELIDYRHLKVKSS
ncbi:2-phosphosulfolactate phosphatase [Bacillus sp. FSL H8-0547]